MHLRAIVDNIQKTSSGQPRLSFNCGDCGADLNHLRDAMGHQTGLTAAQRADRKERVSLFLERIARGDAAVIRSLKVLEKMLKSLCLCGPGQPFGLAIHWFRTFGPIEQKELRASANDLKLVWGEDSAEGKQFIDNLIRAVVQHNEILRRGGRGLPPLPEPAIGYSVLHIDTDLATGERSPDWEFLTGAEAEPIAQTEAEVMGRFRQKQEQRERMLEEERQRLQAVTDTINAAPDRTGAAARSS